MACEDAFLALSERMVEIERQFRAPTAAPLPPPPPIAPVDRPVIARLAHRNGVVQIGLSLKRGDARPFTQDLEHSWQTDCLFIGTTERVVPGTPVEMAVGFEGHVTQLHATGRVMAARVGGFTVQPAESRGRSASADPHLGGSLDHEMSRWFGAGFTWRRCYLLQ